MLGKQLTIVNYISIGMKLHSARGIEGIAGESLC
jgi:hypothetical protein